MVEGPLGGMRVVEIGQDIAVPYAGRLLRLLGAEVCKIEPPAGDRLRRYAPSGSTAGVGGLFRYLNAGKSSVALDPSRPDGRAVAAGLCANADVVLVDEGLGAVPGVAADVAEGAGTVVRLLDFGAGGPYATWQASELVVQAAAGWVSPRGRVEGDPVPVGGRLGEYAAGTYLAVAGLTGRRSRADESPVRVVVDRMSAVFNTVAYDMLRRETLVELGYVQTRYTAYIPGPMRCQDGMVAVNCLTGQHWNDLCSLLGVPEYADRYVEMRYDQGDMEAFYAAVRPWFAATTVVDAVEICQAFRVPAAPITTGATAPDLPPFRERGFFVPAPDGAVHPGPPFRLRDVPAEPLGPAPTLVDGRTR
ncbi:CoA transferase [Dactylosporangium fulvum]|uniref:CoA transferase n=1 Tax=Dactylosporangium fulvum TaxID=53359 RepID=A0ABY5WC13_9ACTN|nr:CoA transferase [Dactylosporangium fulvum]UWP85631.1 CoA transferase [Dactylosporangium fulvum]